MANGVNGSQGAESTVSLLLSPLTILKSYAILDAVRSERDASALPANALDYMAEAQAIQTTSEQGGAEQDPVEDPA